MTITHKNLLSHVLGRRYETDIRRERPHSATVWEVHRSGASQQ